MGANATTFVPSYTSGEVLTAANLSVTNSGIPVFATTVTRDAAFGGTGEKTLAEGQFAYIEATNTTQYYDGAAWQSVGVNPGLVYITGASFSAVSSVSLPNDTFTSAYKAYRMVFATTSASTNLTITARWRAAGVDDTSNAYRAASTGLNIAGGSYTNAGGLNTSMLIGTTEPTGVAKLFSTFDMREPTSAYAKVINGHTFGSDGTTSGVYVTAQSFFGSTAFDSMTFIASTGNMTGFYRLYAYSES